MDSTTLRILKRLTKERELSVLACSELLPKKTNDHLDYYPLASLIKSGLADIHVGSEKTRLRDEDEMEIATFLFASVAAKGQKLTYRNVTVFGETAAHEKVFATAKGYLALDEMRSRRAERLWAFAAGIVTAVFASSLKGLFG